MCQRVVCGHVVHCVEMCRCAIRIFITGYGADSSGGCESIERCRQHARQHDFTVVENDDVAHDVLQLADIAWPVICEQDTFGVRGEVAEGAAFLVGIGAQKMQGDRQYVVLAITQRWQVQRDDMQAVEKVFAKTAFLDLVARIAVGRADEAHIDFFQPAGTDGLEAAALHEAQQFGLQLRAHLADFIEE